MSKQKSQDISLNDFENFRAEAAKLDQLERQKVNIDQRIETIRATYGTDAKASTRAEAIGLLDNDEGPANERDRLGKLQHDCEVVEEAIRVQRDRVQAARREAARGMSDHYRQRHDELVDRELEGLTIATQAARQEAELWERIYAETGFHPTGFVKLPMQHESAIGQRIRFFNAEVTLERLQKMREENRR